MVDYDQGIFDGCQKDAVLDHAVLAKGYGGEGNSMWWRIQNSWGGRWGEQGHIRLKRRDPAAEEAYCGQDKKPSDGVGCEGGPAEVTVCGTCGLLYDPLYPEGVTLEGGSADSSSSSSQSPALAAAHAYEQDFLKDDKGPSPMTDNFKPQVEAAVSQSPTPTTPVYGPLDFLKDDTVLPTPDNFKPQAEPAVSQSPTLTTQDFLKDDTGLAMPDNFKPQAEPTVSQPGSSVSDEASAPGTFQPEVSPAAPKSDTEKDAVGRMKDLFRQNFLQAQ